MAVHWILRRKSSSSRVDADVGVKESNGTGDSEAPEQAAKTTLFAGRRAGSRKKRLDGGFFPINKER
jgi:hypothetical protein